MKSDNAETEIRIEHKWHYRRQSQLENVNATAMQETPDMQPLVSVNLLA